MKDNRLLRLVGEIDDKFIAEAAPESQQRRTGRVRVRWLVAAACAILLISSCFGSYAAAEEAKEYKAAVAFFNDYGMSTEGLTRGEIKAVYRDITTKSFSYSKSAEVIQNSISRDQVVGHEITQENPTPEDVENLWNYKNFTGAFVAPEQSGVHYRTRDEYKQNAALGFEVLDKSYLEQYDGETLVWSASVSEFWIDDIVVVSDGVLVFGQTETLSGAQSTYAYLAKFTQDGKLVWKRALENGFHDEYIAAVLENDDGSYTVFSRGELTYLCLTRYSADGEPMQSAQTEIGGYGVESAARLQDGYIVRLNAYQPGNQSKIVKVDDAGNITESFSYSGEDAYYYITDMIEFNGQICLSAYAVPKFAEEDPNGGRYEIAALLDRLFKRDSLEISSEELTPMVRENYTAMLLVCDPNGGSPQEFYSVKGSLGGKLALSDAGTLLWDVESITTTFFSPMTSSFTIGGTSYVFRYAFDASGRLISREKTGEVVNFRR